MGEVRIPLIIETAQSIENIQRFRPSLNGIKDGLEDIRLTSRQVFDAAAKNADTWTEALKGGNAELDDTDELMQDLRQTANTLRRALDTAFDPKDIQKYSRALAQTETAMDRIGRKSRSDSGLGGMNKAASTGVAIFGRLLAPVTAVLGAMELGDQIKQASQLAQEYEQLEVSFTTFLGDADLAKRVLADLNQFSVSTPFTPDQVNQAGKALLAFGVTSEQLIPTLRQIGDISAGTGKNFNELAVIYGKARIAGTLYAEDINQLIEAGIPIIDLFAKQLGVSNAQVKKLASEGKIGFSELEKAFQTLTSEGGKFFNLTNAQSQTQAGLVSSLTGKWNDFQRLLGDKLAPTVSSLIGFFNKVIDSASRLVNPAGQLSKEFTQQSEKVANLQQTLPALVAEYEQLSSKSSLSADEQDRLKVLLGQIGDIAPSAITQIDEYGNVLGISAEKAKEFLAAEQARLKFINQDAIAATEKQIEQLKRQQQEQKRLVEEGTRTVRTINLAGQTTSQLSLTEEERRIARQKLVDTTEKLNGAEEQLKVLQGQARVELKKTNEEEDKTITNTTNFTKSAEDRAKKIEQLSKSYERLVEMIEGQVFDAQQKELSAEQQIIAQRDKRLAQVRELAVEFAKIEQQLVESGKELTFDSTAAIAKLVDTINRDAARELDEITLTTKPIEVKIEPIVSVAPSANIGTDPATIDFIKEQVKRTTQNVKESLASDGDKFNIFEDIFGVDKDGEEADALREGANQLIGIIQDVSRARIEAANAAVQAADREVEAKQRALDTEIALGEQGLASNINLRQQELAEAQAAQQKALEQQRQAQRQQILLDTALQASNLITSSAKIFNSLAGIPFVGVPLAIGIIAAMFAAFTKAKISALQVSRFREGGEAYLGKDSILRGASHEHGGIGIEAEGGEFMTSDGRRISIINRKMTNKHFGLLQAINKDDRFAMARSLSDLTGGITMDRSIADHSGSVNLYTVQDMAEIKENNRLMRRLLQKMDKGESIHNMGDHIIVKKGNVTSKIRKT